MKLLYLYLLLPVIFLLQMHTIYAKEKLTDDPKSEFSAKVNGKDWKAGVTMCNVEISSLEISGFGDSNFGISLSIDGTPHGGTFEISRKTKNNASYSSMQKSYKLGATDVGSVTITKYDKEKKLFSGIFVLNLTDEKTGEKVHITDGKFTNLAFYDKPPKSSFEFKAKLNGAKWNTIGSTYAGNKDSAQVMALDEKLVLMIGMPQDITAGTYEISDKNAIKVNLVNRDFRDTFEIKKGKLIILNNDIKAKKVNGQFELEALAPVGKGAVKFTDGSFSIFYKEQ